MLDWGASTFEQFNNYFPDLLPLLDRTGFIERIGAAAGIDDLNPHMLRHTHATALLLAGTPEWVVSRRLGHAHVQTTLDLYGWVREDEALRAAANWTSYASGWQVAE